MHEFAPLDVFLSAAAEEVFRMYKLPLDFPEGARVRRDRTASAAPVGSFYTGDYHTLVVAPATSNSVAKFVAGISDTLVTNVFAQAGKCRVPVIVYACDTGPELNSKAPGGMVKVYPRRIDLENVERLKEFSATTVVDSVDALHAAIQERISCLNLNASSS
jgi:flavoprotein